jgi:hypothetical protein
MRPFLKFAPALALLAACGDGPLQPGPYTLDGTWMGTGLPYQLFLELDQDGENRVDGTGEIRALRVDVVTAPDPENPGETVVVSVDTVVVDRVQVEVSGDWDYDTFTLFLSAEGFADVAYNGRFTAATPDVVTGTLVGSGFENAVSINRQTDEE